MVAAGAAGAALTGEAFLERQARYFAALTDLVRKGLARLDAFTGDGAERLTTPVRIGAGTVAGARI